MESVRCQTRTALRAIQVVRDVIAVRNDAFGQNYKIHLPVTPERSSMPRVGPRIISLSLLGVVAALSGCADVPPAPTEIRSLAPSRSLGVSGQNDHRPAESSHRFLAANVPGFAGVHFEGPDAIVVHTTRTDAREPVQKLLLGMLAASGRRPRNGTWNVRFEISQYDFESLAGWRDAVADPLYGMQGVNTIAIDPRTSRISIGIDESADAGELRQLLAIKGVPSDAVNIVTAHVPKPLSGQESLSDRWRPLRAGIQIGPAACTLNDIALWGTKR